MRFLRLPQVKRRYDRSSSAIYRDIKAGHFPKPVKLNPHLKNSPVGWIEAELDAHDEKLIAARDDKGAA